MILSKTSGLLDSHRNLEDELVATFDLVPAGAKIVAVIPHSSLVGPAYAESFLAGDQTVYVVVPIVPGQGVDGVVVDLKGAPVKDARVTAALNLGYVLPRDQMGLSNSVITTSTDGTGWSFSSVAGYVSRTVVTDAEGRFRVENTGTRPLSIWAESGSLRSLSQSTVPGAQVRLILQR